MKCGLLGRKLGHSYSPQIHAFLGNYRYDLFEKEPEELDAFFKNGDFSAINVTIPYKRDVIPYLDSLSPVAEKMGAVNTIVRRKDGTLFGHNTDYYGFLSMINHSNLSVQGKKVLVLGSGGASHTAVAVLEELGAQVVIISRTGENHYGNLHLHQDAAVIVNATPVGMYPNNGTSPLDLSSFPKLEGVLDVIYNPAKTKLLLDAEKLGLSFENGLWMLVAQAKEAAEYFTDTKIEETVIERIYHLLSMQMQNIILIGMPGCGKTTIGSALAEKLHREFVDTDSLIVQLAQKSIPEIFQQEGEASFRRWETEAISLLGKESGKIISTGGGCVTQARNYPLLHQNGTIFWIQRDLQLLPKDGRPLSQRNSLADMYQKREPLYQQFADHCISNHTSISDAVNQIATILEGTT